ncbi:MAG: outer membrane beta-barrel protein [Treponema sp.]|nr:outer membrane beta-barrel protein [Treponema sp.]
MNRKFLPVRSAVIAVVFSVFPVLLFAQALPAENSQGLDYEGKAIVAVLPLEGTETEMAQRFHEGTMAAVSALGNYSPRDVYIPPGGEIPTDMPPVRSLVPGVRYALTGGVYPGSSAGEYYLQLWLWDMSGSTMIYTDDLVYDDIDGALESLSGLVEWLFSHIHIVIIEPPEADTWQDPFFMAGVRAGLSPRWYVNPDEKSSGASALGFEGGFSGALRLTGLLSFQLEILLADDTLVYRDLLLTSDPPLIVTEKFSSLVLTLPLLLKANFRAGLFRLSPLAGFYLALPLGKSHYRINNEQDKESYSWSFSLPLGFTMGFEGAVQYGSGRIFTGLRYSVDFGAASINDAVTLDGKEVQYRRHSFSLYLGYEFGFYDGKKLGGS